MSFAIPEVEWSSNTLDKGAGEDSSQLMKTREKVLRHATIPLLLGGWKNLMVDEAFEISFECSEQGWDGYDAIPLSRDSFSNASRFIYLLPEWAIQPDIIPSPDGWISFEWRSKNNRIFSVTPENEILIYAASLGPKDMDCGRVSFGSGLDKLPSTITKILAEYFGRE